MKLINLGILLGYILIPILIFRFVYIIENKKVTKFAIDKINKNIRKSDNSSLSYDKIESFLTSMGVNVLFDREIEPGEFILFKIFFAFLLFMVGLKINIIVSIPLLFIGFFIPDFILKLSNQGDNNEMLMDIKKMYDTLRIQTKAGMFLTNSLTECYLVVSNKRLKRALLELNTDILTYNDVELAIDQFNRKFKNSQIDSFCIIIKQSLQSGQTVQILNDLSSQIKDIEKGLYLQIKAKTERKLELIELFLFIGVVAIIFYGVFSELMNVLINF